MHMLRVTLSKSKISTAYKPSRRLWQSSGEIAHEFDGNQLDCVRVRLRRCAPRDVSSPRSARASSDYGFKRCGKAGDGTDRDDGCPSPWPADCLGKEFLRRTEK